MTEPTKTKEQKKELEKKIKERFQSALGDIKYMGYVSESGRGTYIFKRNYFGRNINNILG